MALTFSDPMEIGTQMPKFELQDFSGTIYSSSKLLAEKRGILVVFTCNHCPYAKAAWPILVSLSNTYPDIQFIAINSNDPSDYPEDSKERMGEVVKIQNIQFPYLVDGEQDVAKAFKAVCTPDPFLFKIESGEAKLFYHGRINDNWQHPDAVQEENLKDSIEVLLAGGNPPENQPPSMGCSIKWKE